MHVTYYTNLGIWNQKRPDAYKRITPKKKTNNVPKCIEPWTEPIKIQEHA